MIDAIDAPPDTAACVAVTAVDWLPTTMPLDASKAYAVSTDGLTVKDKVSGLLWQRATAPSVLTVTEADAYCASLALAGCTHWRLPQRIELATLVNHQFTAPVIDPTAFPGTPTDQPFWTETPNTSANNNWVINFDNGNTFWNATSVQQHVRCVHSETTGLAPPGRYTVGSSGVLDTQTQLTWSSTLASPQTYANAIVACNTLATAGGGWRLPEIGELETIVDTSRSSPAIDPVAFPGTPSAIYWSSSQYGTTVGMTLDFTSGGIVNAAFDTLYDVRCVR